MLSSEWSGRQSGSGSSGPQLGQVPLATPAPFRAFPPQVRPCDPLRGSSRSGDPVERRSELPTTTAKGLPGLGSVLGNMSRRAHPGLWVVLSSVLLTATGSAAPATLAATAVVAPGWQPISTELHPPGSTLLAFDASDGYVVAYSFAPSGGNCSGGGTTWMYRSGAWSEVQAVNEPPARGSALLAYDAADGYAVLFSGVGCSGEFLNDTWAYHAGLWTNLTGPLAPTGREAASMTYDAADHATLLFGGYGPGGAVPYSRLNDTWEFGGGHWQRLHPPFSPEARNEYSLAYDARDGYAVLFGGSGNGTTTRNGGSCCNLLADTWTFRSGLWTNISEAGAPSPRAGAGIADDPAVPGLILFGGATDAEPVSNDTWTFASGVWSLVTNVQGPPPRTGPSMVMDTADGYVLLYGGADTRPGLLNDTWGYTTSGGTVSTPLTAWFPLYAGVIGIAAVAAVGIVLLARSRRP